MTVKPFPPSERPLPTHVGGPPPSPFRARGRWRAARSFLRAAGSLAVHLAVAFVVLAVLDVGVLQRRTDLTQAAADYKLGVALLILASAAVIVWGRRSALAALLRRGSR